MGTPREERAEDWISYDGIARRYDQVWSARFEPVARRLVDLVQGPRRSVLDVGTGTGVVPLAFALASPPPELLVGCDRSGGMLAQAAARAPRLRVVRGDFGALPFHDASFQVVTASFVLSHVADYGRALAEARRVLEPAGAIGLSNWRPSTDPYTKAWSERLAAATSAREVASAHLAVAPWEDFFSQPGRLEAAMCEAGFSVEASQPVDSELAFTVDRFLADRELSSGGRLGRHLLGEDRWRQFVADTRADFLRRFGPEVRFRRGALIVLGRKAA